MKKVSFVTNQAHHKNKIFTKNLGGVGIGSPDKYYRLHDEFMKHGYQIATDDIHKPEESNIVIYFDMPEELPDIKDKDKSYLLAIESSIIRPENFNTNKHMFFKKIFTWNDEFVNNDKYIKINYAFDFPKEIYKKIDREKLCCMIISNKNSTFENELYTERKKLIRWFEVNNLHDFDLYGLGWDTYKFEGSKLLRSLNRIPYFERIAFKFFGEKYSCYQGKVTSKFETMKKYKFAIAYENVKDEMGYITEKIFDVFIAGCVPVYWGAKNIKDYIPSNCFIDRREFKTNQEMYDFIKNIEDDRYIEYLYNIEKYLNSDKAKQFSVEVFIKTIVENCIDIKRDKESE